MSKRKHDDVDDVDDDDGDALADLVMRSLPVEETPFNKALHGDMGPFIQSDEFHRNAYFRCPMNRNISTQLTPDEIRELYNYELHSMVTLTDAKKQRMWELYTRCNCQGMHPARNLRPVMLYIDKNNRRAAYNAAPKKHKSEMSQGGRQRRKYTRKYTRNHKNKNKTSKRK